MGTSHSLVPLGIKRQVTFGAYSLVNSVANVWWELGLEQTDGALWVFIESRDPGPRRG